MAKKDKPRGEGSLSRIIAGAIVAAVVIAVVVIVMGQKSTFAPVKAGSDMIDFKLPDLEGREVALSSFKGKVIFLNFWATWCKPCEEEIPSMEALYKELKDQSFEIVAVSVDSEGPETVAKYVKRHAVTFKVLHDRKGRIKETYKTTGVPETFIIDQNGVIAEKVWGPRDWTSPSSYTTIADLIKNGPKPRDAYKSAPKQAGLN